MLIYHYVTHAILVHIAWVYLKDYDTKVGSVWYSPVNLGGRDSTKSVYSPVNLGGRDSTKSVYSTYSSLFQSTVNSL